MLESREQNCPTVEADAIAKRNCGEGKADKAKKRHREKS